ncbi:serine hydrolase domain-containing protein [Hymenobacter sp. B81]|uniref:serine hydrolase domain-containing protein n=1 Tax=Hymenobacter sp. B81 TaxID=3344878 RepID=UPI0037DCD81A
MKRLLLCLLLLSTSLHLRAQSPSSAAPTPSAQLHEYFQALANLQQFNGNVLVASQGQELLRGTYNIPGQSDSLRVGPDSRFIIASVSKLFVRYGVLLLAQQGRLSLQDPVSKFIPDFPRGRDITVAHLFHHQSGLPRELTNHKDLGQVSLARTIELARHETLLFEPGARTQYSNVGFFLLHHIVDRASPRGYAHFVQHQILRPFGMKHTGEFRAARRVPRFAHGFTPEANRRIRPVDALAINRFETGNYYATLADLARFADGLFSGRVLAPAAAQRLLNAEGAVVQAGGRPGYRAYFYLHPARRLTFLFVSNFSGLPVEKIIRDVPAIVAGEPYQVPVAVNRQPVTVPDALLQRYVGRFQLLADPAQVFEVRVDGGQLLLLEKSGEQTRFRPDSETTFFDDPQSAEGLRFDPDPATQTYRLVLLSDGLTLPTLRLP